MTAERRFVFVFLDGVGLTQSVTANPLAAADSTPFLQQLLGAPLLLSAQQASPGLLLKPIDACLGVAGLPQSATGQTALYTGCNAPQFRGQHQTGFANGSLRRLIETYGLLRRVVAQGGTATLANLYSCDYFEAIAQRRLRYSVGTLLNLTAGLSFRMPEDYEQGNAIFWDITGELATHRGITAAPITAAVAGRWLARIAAKHTVTLFECYLTDFAGHRQDRRQALEVLRRVDGFLESLVFHLPHQTTLIVSSDHGNVENLGTKKHTLNSVPLLAVGPDALSFQAVVDITGITPLILKLSRSGSRPSADRDRGCQRGELPGN